MDLVLMEPTTSLVVMSVEKKTTSKKSARPPLCTFFNHLGPLGPSVKQPTKTSTSKDKEGKDKKQEKETTVDTNTTSKTTTASDGAGLKDSDDTSVETVNTSNKSIDIYLRPDKTDSRVPRPAGERWKEPPAPTKNNEDDADLMMEGLYITSRCESDSEEEDDGSPARPREIVIRKRGRCPRMQQQRARWNKSHKKYYSLYC